MCACVGRTAMTSCEWAHTWWPILLGTGALGRREQLDPGPHDVLTSVCQKYLYYGRAVWAQLVELLCQPLWYRETPYFMNLTFIAPGLPEFGALLCFTIPDLKEILHGTISLDTQTVTLQILGPRSYLPCCFLDLPASFAQSMLLVCLSS